MVILTDGRIIHYPFFAALLREKLNGFLDSSGVSRDVGSRPARNSTSYLRSSAHTRAKHREVTYADCLHSKRSEREGARKLIWGISVPPLH